MLLTHTQLTFNKGTTGMGSFLHTEQLDISIQKRTSCLETRTRVTQNQTVSNVSEKPATIKHLKNILMNSHNVN